MAEQEFISNLFHVENLYAIFCNYTHMPYVECEEESYSDMAFLFTDEEQAKSFAQTYKEGNQSLVAVRVDQNSLKHFLASLIADGFDMVSVLDKKIGEVRHLPIDKLVTRTLREGVQKPVENPALQLSMMYFLQEIHTAKTDEEKEEARSKEEEMMANIARAIYLVPFFEMEEENLSDNNLDLDREVGSRNVALMHLKNEAGETFIPLFTDLDEFLKIRPKEGTSNFLPMSFQKIRDIKRDESISFIINPGSVNLQLNQHNLDAVDYRFGNQSK